MGMFDNIMCEHPLPAPSAEGLEFQTKDLACDLDHLTIRADGHLVRTASSYGDNPLGHIADFFGEVHFYTSLNQAGNWLEFRARFVDGKLYGPIVLVEDTRDAGTPAPLPPTLSPEAPMGELSEKHDAKQ